MSSTATSAHEMDLAPGDSLEVADMLAALSQSPRFSRVQVMGKRGKPSRRPHRVLQNQQPPAPPAKPVAETPSAQSAEVATSVQVATVPPAEVVTRVAAPGEVPVTQRPRSSRPKPNRSGRARKKAEPTDKHRSVVGLERRRLELRQLLGSEVDDFIRELNGKDITAAVAMQRSAQDSFNHYTKVRKNKLKPGEAMQAIDKQLDRVAVAIERRSTSPAA